MKENLVTYKDIESNINQIHSNNGKSVAIIPVGCTEQHGPFLPITTDSIIAKEVSVQLSTILSSNNYFSYVYPCIEYSPTQSNLSYQGTVSIKDNNFRLYVENIIDSLLKYSFDSLIFISGHGGADHSLKELSFWSVNNQYSTSNNDIKPVLTISLFEFSSDIENLFNQMPGRHADWREFLLLYKILGKSYFSDQLLEKMQDHYESNDFTIKNPSIYGIPVKYRSVDGIIGESMPNNTDYDTLSNLLWDNLLTNIQQKVILELESFWLNYASKGEL